jgi:hypothetical protein
MRRTRQIIAQSGQTMMPMGAGCKCPSMEKVEKRYRTATAENGFPTRVNN